MKWQFHGQHCLLHRSHSLNSTLSPPSHTLRGRRGLLLCFVLGRNSLQSASEQAPSRGEQVPAAEAQGFATTPSPGEADSSLTSVPHNSARSLLAHQGFLFLNIFSTTTVWISRKVLGKFGCVIFPWLLCHWNWQAPHPTWQNSHEEFLKPVCDTGQAKLLIFFLAPVIAVKALQLHVCPMQSFRSNTPAMMIWLVSAKWGFEYIHRKTYHKNYIHKLSWCLPMFLAMSR